MNLKGLSLAIGFISWSTEVDPDKITLCRLIGRKVNSLPKYMRIATSYDYFMY